jgi:hypothetical protein
MSEPRSRATRAAAPGGVAAGGPRLGLALLVLATAQLMVVLDATIVNVALPHIQRALGFSGSGLEWVVNAYALTFGGLLLRLDVQYADLELGLVDASVVILAKRFRTTRVLSFDPAAFARDLLGMARHQPARQWLKKGDSRCAVLLEPAGASRPSTQTTTPGSKSHPTTAPRPRPRFAG